MMTGSKIKRLIFVIAMAIALVFGSVACLANGLPSEDLFGEDTGSVEVSGTDSLEESDENSETDSETASETESESGSGGGSARTPLTPVEIGGNIDTHN